MTRAQMLNLMLSFEVRHSICRIDHSVRMFADGEESNANG